MGLLRCKKTKLFAISQGQVAKRCVASFTYDEGFSRVQATIQGKIGENAKTPKKLREPLFFHKLSSSDDFRMFDSRF
jgi:hypothetical protein